MVTYIVDVVVVDSHVQRVVFASEETTATQQFNNTLIKCQSRLWSQRGTKVNGSHRGDNPITVLLRPTGIQIATKNKKLCDSASNGIVFSKSLDQPGKVANPARGQLNRENEYFLVLVRA